MTHIIDVHTHIGTSLNGYSQTVEQLLASMDKLEINESVIVPVRPMDYAYPSQNDLIAEAAAKNPGRFIAMGRVDPRRPDAAKETERCLGQLGMRGIFVHPFEDTFPVSRGALMDPVCEVCQTHNVPIMVATGYTNVSEGPQVAEIVKRFPNLPVIMTNGGQLNMSGLGGPSAWSALEENKNTYITSSGLYEEMWMVPVLDKIGPDRVLFSSMSPIMDQEFELHRIQWAHTSDENKEKMLSGTARRLFSTAGGK
jgi:uncharacterized protein